ncbi:MAG: hypothetical protein DRJ51_00495 [Thermoprotei archaeon]|nr:MAG: hypothetical protein DRJ51_00495 [Thermoprotei archaeon]
MALPSTERDEEWLKIEGLVYQHRIFRSLAGFIGWERVEKIVRKLTVPVKRYYVRVNTLKTTREELMERLAERGLKAYPDPLLPDAIYFEVKGPYKIPSAPKKVIVDKFAAESVYQGADLYAPGVMRGDPIRRGDEVIILSPTGKPVGYGIAKMDIHEILAKRRGLAVKVLVSVFRAPKIRELKEYEEGLFYDQSYPAMLVSHILEPQPSEIIVDLCASPGGKATHVAQLIRNEGLILAIDRSTPKVLKIKENARRLGITNIKFLVSDSRYLHLNYPALKADRILLDPPCSSLGVRPKIMDRKEYKDIISVMKYQQQFLEAATRILKPGGTLVYSTCTFTVEENEAIVSLLVEKYGLKVVEQKYFLGEEGLGEKGWENLLQRFHPDRIDTPGFFIAKLEKKA